MTETSLLQRDIGSQPDPFQALDGKVHARLADISMGLSPIALWLAQADWALHLATSPGRQWVLGQNAVELGWQAWMKGLQPAAAAEPDARFSGGVWSQWPYSTWAAGFLASEAWWKEVTRVDGVSAHHQHMVEFFARQGLDALSPANLALTNPEVIQAGLDSGGLTWLKGGQRFVQDLLKAQWQNLAPQDDKPATTANGKLAPLPFKVGEDVAVTPGKVVFRNRLFELIQYTPSTPDVHPEPLLVVPSCIMKYYILDLSPGNSMVRYLVAQGFTVFMMSWRNPDATDRELGMQDYLQQGVMQAMAVVKARTAAPRIHALGYCLGGTFLAIVAALLGRLQRRSGRAGAQHRRRDDFSSSSLPELATVSLLAAQTDFSEPGELGVFIDDDQLRTLRETMAKKGYLSGRAMAGSFQFLNSRDLVWSRSIRRYLLAQDDVGNDMMSWNADVTRLPERMHGEYLSSLFLNNALAAGHYRVAEEGVALKDISAPLLVVGTVRDHVSPWRSVYKIHLLTDTQTTFVLVAGGHNAGIVSEPGHARRSYQMARVEPGHGWTEPEAWAAQAARHEGSWWVAMADWLKARSSKLVAAPTLAPADALCDAPGEYIHVRYAD